jgi:PleD family two-component response regulator
VQLSGGSVKLTVSLGVTVVGGEDRPDADSAIFAADEALYRAKASGRNRVECGGSEPASAGTA